jgi:hypothetical protein
VRSSVPILPFRIQATAFCLCLALFFASAAQAEVSTEQRTKILLTALAYNRTLLTAPFGITMGVFGSCETGDALMNLETKQIGGKPFSTVTATKLTYAYFDSTSINVIYLCSVSPEEAELLGKVAPRLSVTVFAENPALVDSIALFGIREVEGKPRLRLNMKVARESKIELDPRILGSVEVAAQ